MTSGGKTTLMSTTYRTIPFAGLINPGGTGHGSLSVMTSSTRRSGLPGPSLKIGPHIVTGQPAAPTADQQTWIGPGPVSIMGWLRAGGRCQC